MPRYMALVFLVILGLTACAGGGSAGPVPLAATADTFSHPPTLGPTPTMPVPVSGDLDLDRTGHTRSALSIASTDGWMRLEIPAGTRVTNAQGAPVRQISITPIVPGKLPMMAFGYPAGLAYQFGPEEIRFDPPARLVFVYTEKGIGRILPSELGIGRAQGEENWIQYNVQADTTHKEIVAVVSSLVPDWRYMLVAPALIGS